MKFVLSIELGNEAMQDSNDLANALSRTAIKVAARGDIEVGDSGGILDLNGNKVGKWEIAE